MRLGICVVQVGSNIYLLGMAGRDEFRPSFALTAQKWSCDAQRLDLFAQLLNALFFLSDQLVNVSHDLS